MLLGLVFTVPVTQMISDTQEEVTNVSSSLWLYDVWENTTEKGDTNFSFEKVYVDDIDATITAYNISKYGYDIDNNLDFFTRQDIPANSTKKIYITKGGDFQPTQDTYLAKFTGSKGDWLVSGGTFNFGSDLEAYRVETSGDNYVYQQLDDIPDNTKVSYRMKHAGYYNQNYYSIGSVSDNLGSFNDINNGYGVRYNTANQERNAVIKNSTEYVSSGIYDIGFANGWFYVETYRCGDEIQTYIYDDATKSNLLGTNTYTKNLTGDLKYIYLYQNDNRGDKWSTNHVDDFYFRKCSEDINVTVTELTNQYEVTITNTGSTDLVDMPVEIDGDKINVTSTTDSYAVNDLKDPIKTTTIKTNQTSTTFNLTDTAVKNKIINIGNNLTSINMSSNTKIDYNLDVTYIKERIKRTLDHTIN
jgi:hypothetical protein